jgi:KUP system potassium uptake protein
VLLRPHGIAVTHDNVLGVLSLIVWALISSCRVKYIAIVMRADNEGEGGILALTALVLGRKEKRSAEGRSAGAGASHAGAPGSFGTALLYGDGMIHAAISVLGAVEG